MEPLWVRERDSEEPVWLVQSERGEVWEEVRAGMGESRVLGVLWAMGEDFYSEEGGSHGGV